MVPNKVFDALACGRPVVTADRDGAREWLHDGETALLDAGRRRGRPGGRPSPAARRARARPSRRGRARALSARVHALRRGRRAARGAGARMTAPAGAAGPPTDEARQAPADGAPPKAASRRRRVIIRLVQVAFVVVAAYFLIAYLIALLGHHPGLRLDPRPGLARRLRRRLSRLLLRCRPSSGGCSCAPAARAARSGRQRRSWGKSILARYMPGNVFMFVGRAWMSHSQGLPSSG